MSNTNVKRTTSPQPAGTPEHSLWLAPVYMVLGLFGFHTVRELVDALVGALVLALLFRAFDAEAFRIPTGSMAPTLMGHHKDLECNVCHFPFAVSASSEVDESGQGRVDDVVQVTCPQCRVAINVDPRSKEGREYPSYAGDRILVGKATYEFSNPSRWDVAVFKNPAMADQNYIKRIVGLPNETVRISHGDLHVQPSGRSEFELTRRAPAKLRAMAQIVYDNDYTSDMLTKHHWPVRWQPLPTPRKDDSGAWSTSDGSHSYSIDGTANDEQWLRYQHFTPSIGDWAQLSQGPLPASYPVRPRLVTDFYAYDAGVSRRELPIAGDLLGMHWVGDLLLECEVRTSKGAGVVALDLVKGGRHFRCAIQLDSGDVALSIDGESDFSPTAKHTRLAKPGKHHLLFANVDRQLVLWIDNRPVEFDQPTTYPPLDNDRPRASSGDPGDLAPAGISSHGAALSVNHLRLWRDIYYIAGHGNLMNDYNDSAKYAFMEYAKLLELWTDPRLWSPKDEPSPFADMTVHDFLLEADQFFVLGDNSPKSSDARLWDVQERYVRRDLLVGKAEIIFWPHSFHQIPGTGIPFPFFPNFARIGFIR